VPLWGWALLMGATILAAGCDSGPSGPGDLQASVQTPGTALGGAALEVVGKGITSFSGTGSTRVFWAATSTPDTYRVVLVTPTPGPLQFRVSVEDMGTSKPVASFVALVGGDDIPVPATTQYRVVFTRK
jgi:hypothetical protein